MRKTVVLTPAEVRQLLPMADCMDQVEVALQRLSAGAAVNPLRNAVRIPDGRGMIGLMPGYLDRPESFGLKAVSIFPGNHGTELDSHQGVVVLFDTKTGVPATIMDASEITAIRTAAASGVATRLLARPDADSVGMIGSGVQARTHLQAMQIARPLKHVRIFSPNRKNAEHLAAWFRDESQADVEVAGSARQAVEKAAIVCTTTSATQPVVEGAWLSPGAHVNAVGACVPTARELDADAMARSRLFVDCRESAVHESGDYLIALAEGAIGEHAILGEIGEILAGRLEGRRDTGEITLFKSLGVAVEDLATAHLVLERARAGGIGTLVALGGLRDVPG